MNNGHCHDCSPHMKSDGKGGTELAYVKLCSKHRGVDDLLTRLEEAEKERDETKAKLDFEYNDGRGLNSLCNFAWKQRDSLRDRMIGVVEQKRDGWLSHYHDESTTASGQVRITTMVGAANEIITALKAVDGKGEGEKR